MKQSVIATLFLGIVFFFAQKTETGASLLHPTINYMLVFYLMLSYLIERLMSQGLRNNREKFVQFYMTVTVLRLLLCLVFVGIFLYNGVENPHLFILDFFALYLFYTCFEIWGIYRKLRAN